MRPRPGEVLHFSEDPTITVFAPHVAATARQATPFVWAVDGPRAPAYWFPRDCPRAMAWSTSHSTADDAERLLGPGGGSRVHAVEYGWLDRIRTVSLFGYRRGVRTDRRARAACARRDPHRPPARPA